MSYHCDDEGRILAPEHDGSTTDTLQWCELHRGHCHDVVPVRRVFDEAPRSHGSRRSASHKTEIFLACQSCVRDLKKAGLLQDSKFARHECYEIQVPRGLGQGRKAVLGKGRKVAPSTHRTSDRQQDPSDQQSFEVTLNALQVKYLRALGLRVIPA